MIDPVQIFFLVVIAILTALAVIIGVQVYYILRELRGTITRANKVLDDTGDITESVARPIESLSSLVDSLSTGAAFVKMLKMGLGFSSRSEDKKYDREA